MRKIKELDEKIEENRNKISLPVLLLLFDIAEILNDLSERIEDVSERAKRAYMK